MRFEVTVEHRVPWKPMTRAGLGLAQLVARVRVGPGDAHVGVAVQESQHRQGHTRPACRRTTETEEGETWLRQDLPLVQTVPFGEGNLRNSMGLSLGIETHVS